MLLRQEARRIGIFDHVPNPWAQDNLRPRKHAYELPILGRLKLPAVITHDQGPPFKLQNLAVAHIGKFAGANPRAILGSALDPCLDPAVAAHPSNQRAGHGFTSQAHALG